MIENFLSTLPGLPREVLENTPNRHSKALQFLVSGYSENPQSILAKTFDDLTGTGELVIVKEIPFWSLCQHHVLPFNGVCSVGYLPKSRVVGLSKIPRLINCFARRLQVQEQLTYQIADAIYTNVETDGVMCLIKASHTCMQMRGALSSGVMETLSSFGVLSQDNSRRSECLRLLR